MRSRLVAAICLAACVLAPAPAGAQPPAPVRVVVLVGGDSRSYASVLQGLQEQLHLQAPAPAIEIFPLATTAVAAESALSRNAAPPAVVVALGTAASALVRRSATPAPVVVGMVLREADVRELPNATGVYLEFPVETELAWLRRVAPLNRHVGVVFSATNAARVRQAVQLAARSGLQLLPREVRAPQEIPEALRTLTDQADALWGLTDPIVYTPETAKTILLFSVRNRIPFAGSSLPWVKAGALYAIDRDYRDVGRQCGELAAALLGGQSPAALTPAPPRRVVWAVNRRTAEVMHLELAGELVQGAAEVVP
ncbi:MAG TPA: ABC transporter substrate binding protein [Candidatus Polarisedimenticolaceae bacterium]|nr:ABC transporter substrate binding protein [Candidatus Polarisedimenticolaceae bacterium]